jgi:predicted Zn-dependent protease
VGLGLLFLKYGRDAENQADELGFRYMTKDGYDPRAISSVFQMLARTSALAGQGRLPEWQSTHPYPEDRVENNDQRVAQLTQNPSTMKVNRTAYVREIDGLVFGEDPRQGFFEGTRFNHPDLRFRFDFPAGWKTQNQPAAVVGQSANQDALMSLSFAQAASPRDAMQQFLGQQGIRAGQTSNAAINGFTASWAEFEATTADGVFVGQIAYVQDGSRIYQILAYTTSAGYRTYSSVFQQSIHSYNRLTDQAALNKQPVRLHMVQINRDMTIEQFNQSYPSTIKIEYLAAINAVQPGERIPSGSWVKQVR